MKPDFNMDFSKIKSPMIYAAGVVKFGADVPGSDKAAFPAKVYSVDIKAARHGGEVTLFEDVLFLEQNSCASIYGIENENGLPDGLRKELALKQQKFIHFLRNETARKNEALGLTAVIFEGWQYSQEQWATIAYVIARAEPLNVGIGYLDPHSKKYERIAVHADDLADTFESAGGGGFDSFDEWAASGKE